MSGPSTTWKNVRITSFAQIVADLETRPPGSRATVTLELSEVGFGAFGRVRDEIVRYCREQEQNGLEWRADWGEAQRPYYGRISATLTGDPRVILPLVRWLRNMETS